MPRRRRGRQEPTFERVPAWDYTDGRDAALVMKAFRVALDPWQRHVVDAWLARRADDSYACESCGLSVPRQNGKTALAECRCVYGAAVCGERILFTAHEVKTARKAFTRMLRFFSDEVGHPEFAALVSEVRRSNGQEAIVLTNGGSVEFSARSSGASRGFTVDVVMFDEAQMLTDEQMDALLFTLAAAPSGNRQFVFLGTPPLPACPGEVFRRHYDAAHAGSDPTLAWHEWAATEVGDVSDKSRWWETNPGMGIRLTEAFTAKEMVATSPDGFARERLGWWEPRSTASRLVGEEAWAECETASEPDLSPGGFDARSGTLAYGVKFSPDGSRVAVAVAVRPKEGPVHCELVADRPMTMGVGWLADWLCERRQVCSVAVVDGKGAAPALFERIGTRMPRRALVMPGVADVKAAAAMTVDAIRDKRMVHVADERLARSVTSCVRRPIGADGGFGFGGDDPTPTEALSLALWGAKTTKRRAGRGCRAL